jgi:4-hydroxybenzoate polyprenyltransferase
MASPSIRTTPREFGLDGAVSVLSALVECARPAQWSKNIFVLAALVFCGKWTNLHMALRELIAVAAFSLAASGIYFWNDILDWRSDLAHPTKRHRPIPSGRLRPIVAGFFGSTLLLSAFAIGFAINQTTALLLGMYVAVNTLYVLWLKHQQILDLLCIAVGFVLRVSVGASAINVKPSHWLLMCTFLLSLLLAIAKRRSEVVTLRHDRTLHRRVLEHYSVSWLDQASTLVASSTVVAYALYTVAPETQARFGSDRLIYTLPFIVYGILRYLFLIRTGDSTGDPTMAVIADKLLLICIATWSLTCIALIYL